jgi:CheY-like chemotaxis protein
MIEQLFRSARASAKHAIRSSFLSNSTDGKTDRWHIMISTSAEQARYDSGLAVWLFPVIGRHCRCASGEAFFSQQWGDEDMPARILLIEDDPGDLYLMNYVLNAYGYSAVTAMDGPEGMVAVLRKRPDLIICEMQLPTMDGYEIARRLKGDPELRAIPLVAVTPFVTVRDRDKALAAGFDGFIAKPIKLETFVQQVELYLRPDQLSAGPSPDAARE